MSISRRDGLHGQGVDARCEGDVRHVGDRANPRCIAPVDKGTVSQLLRIIVAPAAHAAVYKDGAVEVESAALNETGRHGVAEANVPERGHRPGGLAYIGGLVGAQLPVQARAPADDATRCKESAAAGAARDHDDRHGVDRWAENDERQGGDLGRGVADLRLCSLEPKLAITVSTPAACLAVIKLRTNRVNTRINVGHAHGIHRSSKRNETQVAHVRWIQSDVNGIVAPKSPVGVGLARGQGE